MFGLIAPMKVAPDTNLLAYGASRRLLHGMALDSQCTLVVLPEVAVESTRRIAAYVEDMWVRQLMDRHDLPRDARVRIAGAAGAGAREWFENDLLAGGGCFEAAVETFDLAWEARKIAVNLPPGALRGSHPDRAAGDPLIIGQALAFDVDLLSTNNFRTMHHPTLNDWAAGLGRDRPLLYTPDESVAQMQALAEHTPYEWSLAYGPWRIDEADEDASRAAFEDSIGRIKGAGFINMAQEIQWEYEGDDGFWSRAQALLRSSRSQAALATEDRMRERVIASATAAGWSR